jgi:hypothetical protein
MTISPLNSPQGERSLYVTEKQLNGNFPLEGAGGEQSHHELMKTILL